ncbi:hypothetical protein AJ87_44715 [Rhizobium yanglingense]|nr:hypothetical protein AJ87_44715 [Rhizobium yanglingense]
MRHTCQQQRSVNLAFHDPLRCLKVKRWQKLISAFDIGGCADDVIEPTDLSKQAGDLILLCYIDCGRVECRGVV